MDTYKTKSSVNLTGQDNIQKAAAMYDIFLHQRFKSTQAIQRMRLQLLMRIIRNKLIANLKRAFDIVLTSFCLPFAVPFMLPIVIAIKLDSPGPVLYKQVRVGKWGQTFDCYKFRSMYVDADARKQELMAQNEADEIVFKMKQDPRITRVGRYLRKTSLDELPQLFNVLKGDMSLVGPRPPIPEEVQYYTFDHLRRLDVIPGITGLQQISGRSDLEFKRWIELDLQYIENQSLRKDIEILLKTFPAVISGRGAY